jgi:hypothetical protein
MTDADVTPNELYEYLETGYIKHGVLSPVESLHYISL